MGLRTGLVRVCVLAVVMLSFATARAQTAEG